MKKVLLFLSSLLLFTGCSYDDSDLQKRIDDLDEFLFNGELVGKTGEDTPYYWSVPRRYRIPAERILWGKENRFTVRVL